MATPPALLRPIGFWSNRSGDGLPDPRRHMSSGWEPERRRLMAGYLKSCPILELSEDAHACIVCGEDHNASEHTDGTWRWPASLAHYVAAHGVKIPTELVDHMARQNFRAPRVDVRALQDSLAPKTVQATKLISKSHVAEALGEMLDPNAERNRTNDALDDSTTAIPVAQAWRAVVSGVPTKPQKITFDRPIVLGRDRTCDVVLQHQSVSRRHARLVPWRDRVIVQDLDSANGVWVKGERQRAQFECRDGDQVSLGQAVITIVRDAVGR